MDIIAHDGYVLSPYVLIKNVKGEQFYTGHGKRLVRRAGFSTEGPALEEKFRQAVAAQEKKQ